MTALATQRPQRTGLTAAEAERLCAEFEAAMAEVIRLTEEETTLVRAGRLFAAGELEAHKSDAAKRYFAEVEKIRQAAVAIGRVAPVAVDRLRRQHDAFRALLQFNLSVLATARQVSENLLKAVSDGVARAAQPKRYGAAGTFAARSGAAAIAVDRSL
ncbi:MAG: hypothetical protein U1E56_12405 [Bauldia sp.]